MKKRILPALLVLAMCNSLVSPVVALAADDQKNGKFSDPEAAAIELFAASPQPAERQILNFNKDWRFEKGENKTAGEKEFDDSDWRMLNLPHDYSIENDFDPESLGKSGGGYLDGGPAWYRKTVVLPESMAGKRVNIDFEGVYMNSKVYVNGTLIGEYPYGYSPFSYDITDYVVTDGMTENVIAVYVNNVQPSSRWYSGSGIYRDVTMTVTEPVHVARYGTYVTTPDLESEIEAGGAATAKVDTKVENESDADATVAVKHTAYYKGNLNGGGSDAVVATVTTEGVTVSPGTVETVSADLSIPNPQLWEVGKGGLYALHTEILVDGMVKDTFDTDFGLRWMDFTPNGFFLNGKYTKMRGVCQHHDQGALGAVNNQTALDRQIRILRESGVNSIRSSHNPASRALLNACNEQGIMVMNEAFDTWFGGKNDNDFHQFFDTPCTHPEAKSGQTWQEFDIKNMVDDAKNDPAVIMWSIGNEIGEAWNAKGRETGMQLAAWIREVDDSGRAVTQADPLFGDINPWYFDPANKSDHWQLINDHEAVGFNYGKFDERGYDKAHELNPDWFIYSSETSSAVATRGEYFHPEVDSDPDAGKHRGSLQCSEFDNDHVNWGTTLHYALKEDAKRKYLGGLFFWTGFDYIGEPAPFSGKNQAKSSYFGYIDTCGFPKDSFYLLQSQWLDVETDPMVHILPHWNWEGDNSIQVGADGKAGTGYTPIRIYSNAPTVEVFLNGTSLGKKSFVQHAETETSLAWQSDDSEQQNLYLQWQVPYAPGTVEAVAYDKDGNEIARDVKKTAGDPAAIKLTSERDVITADGEDLAYIVVDVVDENGVIDPRADIPVNFSISGNGRIVGTDNGNPIDWTNMKSTSRSTFNGKALVIVQSTTNAGSFTVTASAAGLPLSSTTVYTTAPEGGDTGDILGYDTVSVKTPINTQPTLPVTVNACYADGAKAEKAVTWGKISAEDLSKAGYITVNGEVETGASVKATVEVVDVVGVRPVSAVTMSGVQPVLPDKVFVVSSDGSETEYPVTWEKIEDSELIDGAVLMVNGTLAGSTLTATAQVRVVTEAPRQNVALAVKGAEFPKMSASAVSPYDPLAHVNDGIISYNTNPKNGWSNWSYDVSNVTPERTDWLICEFEEAPSLDNVSFYFRNDGNIYVPKTINVEYWNGTAWTAVANQSNNTGFVGGKQETITFDAVTTNQLKVTFIRGQQTPGSSKERDCFVLSEVEMMSSPKYYGETTADLATLTVDGTALEDFDSAKTNYVVNLPYGAEIPTVAATGADNATVLVLPAISNNSAASIQVTSEDGKTTKTYYVQFVESPAAIQSATLRMDKNEVLEDDMVTIHVDALLEDGTLADEDLLNIKYSIDAGVPAKAEIKGGRLYAYKEGDVTLKASIGYLNNERVDSEELKVTIQPNGNKKSILSYSPVTVSTVLNQAPDLPRIVKAKFDLGLAQDVAVTWDTIDPSQYARYGSFTVNGTVEGQALRPTATVYVRNPIAAKNQSMATPVGIAPPLPETIPVYSTDGTATYSEVTWNEYDPDALKTEGIMNITGVTALGTLPVTLTLRVTNDTIQSENYAQLWTGFKYSMAFIDKGQQGANVLNNGKVDKWCSWGEIATDTMNLGIIFGKDYPGLRNVDTVNLNMFQDTSLDKTGLVDCKVQYYNKEFKLDDTPQKPNNMLDSSMAGNPLNDESNWTDVTNLKLPEGGFVIGDNTITFDMVNTYAIRLQPQKKGQTQGTTISASAKLKPLVRVLYPIAVPLFQKSL